MKKTALIFGITGQDGALLARFLLEKSYRVIGSTRGIEKRESNLERLNIREQVEMVSGVGFRHIIQCLSLYQPQEVYNLGAQSSVGASFHRPFETFESIATVTADILEAIRILGQPVKFFNPGSGECFGDTGGKPATEQTPFSPQSPYAAAKASAHWQVASYRDLFGIFACTGFLYNHESWLRPEGFVTRKIVNTACRIARNKADSLVLGDLSIQRDWGWAPEYVRAMWLMLQQEQPEDYILATGHTLSLGAFVSHVFAALGLDWKKYTKDDARFFRSSDVPIHRADPGKARKHLGWQAEILAPDVAVKMVDAQLQDMEAGKK